MADLKDLLARANAKIKADEENKKAIKRARLAGDEAEVAAINAKVKAWQEAQEWVPGALVLRLPVYICRCGAEFIGLAQPMVKMEHVRIANTTRLVAATEDDLERSLPRFQMEATSYVRFCHHCAEDHGYQRLT